MILRFMFPVLLAGALVGVYSARYFPISQTALLLALIGLAVLSVRLPRLILLAVLVLGVSLGSARSSPLIDGYAEIETVYGSEIVLIGKVQNDPVLHKTGQLEFNVDTKSIAGKEVVSVARIRSFTRDLRRGDTVEVTGKVRDGFAYWQSSMYFAETTVLDRDGSNLGKFRRQFVANLYSILPDPESSLGLGFLIGIRTLLPDELVSQLSITGLTHIVAVSGYNLTVLANAAKNMLKKGSRMQAAVLSIGLVYAFIAITGWSPSILRAAVVSTISIAAWLYGRSVNPYLLLLYSSSLSAVINPAYAWFDIGWYLSLAAFFGILVLAPLLTERIFKGRNVGLFPQIILETSCAQLLTMPIILLVFGEVSVIALLANAVVLPMVPIAMLGTFIAGVTFFISEVLAGLVLWPVYWVLRYITDTISLMAEVEWALIPLSVGPLQLALMYLLIAAMVAVLTIARRKRRVDLIYLLQDT